LTWTKKIELFKKNKRPIIRGTWFWRANDGSYTPYENTIADLLEMTFQKNSFVNNFIITDPKNKSKKRRITQFTDGTFRQYRISESARGEGRGVLRGYLGQVEEFESLRKTNSFSASKENNM